MESKALEIYILVIFERKNDVNVLILKRIKFFKDQSDIQNYINYNDLKLILNKELKKDSVLWNLKMLISRYLKTGNLNLYKEIQNLKIDLDVDSYFSTVFSKKVLNALLNIPGGSTCSYSKIGEMINSQAFRAIGSVLKKNPLPLIIPCHRVIRKDGTIGGFMGKADDSWQTNLKNSLLELEKE